MTITQKQRQNLQRKKSKKKKESHDKIRIVVVRKTNRFSTSVYLILVDVF